MPSLSTGDTNLAESLASGVDAISASQTVNFTVYQRSVVPTDGYVFFVNSGQTQSVAGSLHYSISREQSEDETNDSSRVIFTALSQVDAFNSADPQTLFVGEVDGIQFAFSGRAPYYEQAGLYHYIGLKATPALASQLIDSVADLPAGPIVSNSLPIWLAQPTVGPVYPSFLVPANVKPPYVAVHVDPAQTVGAHFPIPQWPGTTESGTDPSPLHDLASLQLSQDRVRLTLYGFTNQQAIQYLTSLMEYSMSDAFGFANVPVVRDEKRAQAELAVIAMKKTIDIVAWYYQSTADVFARRLILSATLGSLATQ